MFHPIRCKSPVSHKLMQKISLQPPSSLLSPSFFSSISASWAPVRNCTHASKAPSLHRTCQFCTLGIKYCNLGWRIWNITWTAEHNVVGLLQRTWEEARSTDHSSSHCLVPRIVMTTLVWRVVGIMIKSDYYYDHSGDDYDHVYDDLTTVPSISTKWVRIAVVGPLPPLRCFVW